MKLRLITIFLTLLILCSFYSYSQDIAWVQHAGTKDRNIAYSVATDAEGNSFITGHFHESIKFGDVVLYNNTNSPGSSSSFIAKFDPAGKIVWAKNGVGLFSRSYAVAVDKDGNSYMAGYTFDYVTFSNQEVGLQINSDLFVAKYNSSGDLFWIATGLSSYDFGRDLDIKVDASGNVYVAGGIISGGVDSGSTYYNAFYVGGFVFKLNAEGQQVYRAGLGNATAYNLALDEAGQRFYVLGSMVKTGYIGTHRPASAGQTDIFLAGYNAASGEVEWLEKFGSSSEELATGIAVDKQGDIYIAGTITADLNMQGTTLKAKGGTDIMLAKVTKAGTVVWAQNVGSATNDYVTDLTLDNSGNPYITGVYTGTATFGTKEFTATSAHGNIYLAQFSPTGAFNAFHTLGGTGKQESKHITFDKANNLFFAGTIAGDVQFGQLGANANTNELFVAKIKSESLVKQPDPSGPEVTTGGKLPNIITPNGDGKNDMFNTSVFTGDQGQKRFTVYNRYGALVYHSNDYQDNWSANGLSDGAYFYTLTFIAGEEPTTCKGWVEVIR